MNGPGRIHEIGHTPNFSPTIIIIDDDHEVVENIYRVLLEEAGYRVLSANNGAAGLELLMKETRFPDLLLVDCSMPQMDGETFLTELKAKLPRIFSETKVVGLTAFDPTSPFFLRIKELAFDCRQKPSSIEGILKIASDFTGPVPMQRVV